MMKDRKKTGGRKAGTPNKTTADLRKWVSSFIEGQTIQIEKDWKTLRPLDRITLFEKLLKYSLPALQSVSNKVEFEDMSDEDLDYIIEGLKKNS